MIARAVGLSLLLLAWVSGAAAVDDGSALFNACRACHSLDPAAKAMAGPNLGGLLGRKVAGDEKFDYSPVLRQARDEGRMWSADALEKFIADPEALFPGTWMSRVPMGAPERAALVRFITDPASR
jgi:cytochrome c